MTKDNFKKKIIIISIFLFNFYSLLHSEIIILTECKNLKDGFIKNEYILDLKKSLMSRNFVYDNKTYKKLKLTDLSVGTTKKMEQFIYKEKNLILTDKIGYPQFYTQLLFEKSNPIIKIKTVINNQEATSKLSTCKKIETFNKES